MTTRSGQMLYWIPLILAGLVAVVVVAGYVSDAGEGEPVIPIAALLVGGVILLAGWVCRHLIAGR